MSEYLTSGQTAGADACISGINLRRSALLLLAVGLCGSAVAQDVNGGSSWGGWTLQGASNSLGIYGTGQTANPYNVYTSVFSYSGQTATGGTGGGGGTSGFGGFSAGDTILGVGIKMLGGEAVGASRTLRIDLGNNSYLAAASVGGGDGKTSSTSFANDGDFNVQNSSTFVANQLVAFTPAVNITAESSNPYGSTRPFASFKQTDSYQIFVDLSKVGSWAALSVAAGVGVGADPIGSIGSTLTFALNGYGDNNVVIGNLSTSVAAVPEPETYAMLLAGLGVVGAFVRRRKSTPA